MDPIRVHFGPMPEMLRTIISDLLRREPDIVISGRSARHEDCLRAAREEDADILVAQDMARDGSTCLDLILAEPPLGVLAVSADGHSASGVSLARHPITLETGSPSILADAIRRMVRLSTAPSTCPRGSPERPPEAPRTQHPNDKGGGSS